MISQQFPKDFIRFIDLFQIESVEIYYNLEIQEVTKHLEAFLWWTTMQKNNTCNITHTLNIANIRTKILVSL
jgi:hypothetical protein